MTVHRALVGKALPHWSKTILQILESHLERMIANIKELRENLKAKEEAHLERMEALL
jgi:hypothetical protein